MSEPEKELLSVHDFSDFFRHVHGYEPFPWQERLTEQVLRTGEWPRVIDLPTGSGKTATIDTAVFSLALRPDIFPRRIIFVIDRRVVVDQVAKRAQQIREKILAAETPIARAVRDQLQKLSDGDPLGVASLRGGVVLDSKMSGSPDQPWIVVSTVDQIGSRLLFRGYGIGKRMRSVHAALAGNDCLVILDEVHLSLPFAQTLESVSRQRTNMCPRRFFITEMSATPASDSATRFTLCAKTDLAQCAELRRRVVAEKKAKLVAVKTREHIPSKIAEIIDRIASGDLGQSSRDLFSDVHGGISAEGKHHRSICAVGVIVNRVHTARRTYHLLADKGITVHLLTGRMRPLDKVRAVEQLGPTVDPDRDNGSGDVTVIVATQAIEVGADFNFDAMITECAPVDSLRQRFGRLDRRGTYYFKTGTASQAWIICPESDIKKSADPIYGESVKHAWRELQKRENKGWVNVGSQFLQDFSEDALAPRLKAPLLLQTYMEAWVQTGIEPLIQPSVEWFLHGVSQNRAGEVSVLWRWDTSTEALRLVPPRQAEMLQIPIGAARKWLAGEEEEEVADVTLTVSTADYSGNTSSENVFTRWNGRGKKPTACRAGEIKPGDVLVLTPEYGGLNAGTWDPASQEPIQDLGDQAQYAYRKRITLRLDPRLIEASDIPMPSDEISAEAPAKERISEWLKDYASVEITSSLAELGEIAKYLQKNGFEHTHLEPDNAGSSSYYVLTERAKHTSGAVVDDALFDGSDATNSFSGTRISLRKHLRGVAERARATAERLGMPPEIVSDLELAGRLHDVGKVDPRFQANLVGGDRIALAVLDEPLAKSLPGARSKRIGIVRHEVSSLALIESTPSVLCKANDKDLVLHLVASHHGYGRPMLSVIKESSNVELQYEYEGHSMSAQTDLSKGGLALETADRFWRLSSRYGHYGLAWLEAILRLADHAESREL